ncbi:hypothetical protein GWO43_10680, partial [candidate division KSB1 bacterium]|nr:hypothetical protein [candidate division KSB1 bacterium]NIS24401.1 hypothetical protein [candidate division KSB1 bacterium]NIT71336.1 hypothetical protein [candidate division KSB1 bacterium]NIU25016.1 hypothetical protein [candidate division KSB1 bacterium]NIU91038.1 hypothetical protein [candidate division KSB1 bacterium]
NGNGDPIGDEFRVDLNTRPVGNSDIATDALDRVIAVWIDAGDALGENVFARRFDNNNTFLEPPFQVDIDPGEFGNQPIDAATIAADNDGGFVVVWRESDVVLYRRFDSSANPLTSEINVAPSTGVGSSFPDVAIDNQNIITILYPRREAVPESGDLVFARRFDENDNPIGEELRVDQG